MILAIPVPLPGLQLIPPSKTPEQRQPNVVLLKEKCIQPNLSMPLVLLLIWAFARFEASSGSSHSSCFQANRASCRPGVLVNTRVAFSVHACGHGASLELWAFPS